MSDASRAALVRVLQAVQVGTDAEAVELLEDARVGGLLQPADLQAVLKQVVRRKPQAPHGLPMLRTVEHLLVKRGVQFANTAFTRVIGGTFEAAFDSPHSATGGPPEAPSPARVRAAHDAGMAMLRLLLRCAGGAAGEPAVGTHGYAVGPCTLATIAHICEWLITRGHTQPPPREWLALPEEMVRELLRAGVTPAAYSYAPPVNEWDEPQPAGEEPPPAGEEAPVRLCALDVELRRRLRHNPDNPLAPVEEPASREVRLLRMLTGRPGPPEFPPQLLHWTHELHTCFPPAFQAAARTLLLALHRREQQRGAERLPPLPPICLQRIFEEAGAALWPWVE